MSRSKLKDKWMRKNWDGRSQFRKNPHNIHRTDECPKNKVSKYISIRISDFKVTWLQEPGSFFGGHKPRKGGHRRVSGIVRAKVKNEIRNEIDEQINEK